MRIPKGATHEGMMTGKFFKVRHGIVHVWMEGEWHMPRQSTFSGLLSGTGVVTDRSSQGYYKLSLEEIMDSYIGSPSPTIRGNSANLHIIDDIAAMHREVAARFNTAQPRRAPTWSLPTGVGIVDDLV